MHEPGQGHGAARTVERDACARRDGGFDSAERLGGGAAGSRHKAGDEGRSACQCPTQGRKTVSGELQFSAVPALFRVVTV